MTEKKPIWDELPEPLPVGWAETLYYPKPDLDAFHEKLKGKITQIHECLGEYESKEWCGHCIADAKCAQITMHILELKKKADTLTLLFGKKGVKTENLMKIQMWREKAERWDQYAIYDNDNEPKILVKDLITAYEKLEDVRKLFIPFPEWIEWDHTTVTYDTEKILKFKKILEAEE